MNIEYIKKNWGVLAALGLFVFGVLATFLIPPAVYFGDEQAYSNWGKFVATIAIGLVLVAVILFREAKHTSKWWVTGLAMFLVSTSMFFTYQYLHQKYTCSCYGDLILMGNELKNPEVDFVKENRNDCQKLLKGASCDAERVWTKSSIDNNRLILVGLYTLSLPFLVTAMISVVQAVYCARKRTR